MHSRERRTHILGLLKGADKPYTGTELSELFGVTRQVIVSDVAILRAAGEKIVATP
ncbi:MAG TPA: HTH domain-containing protein, partial [Bacillota bacterium]|nr:HTH domain-containing protein [Bacillota bacterium]